MYRKNSEGHYVDEIKIDEDGKFLDKWPHGFFKERSQFIYNDDLQLFINSSLM